MMPSKNFPYSLSSTKCQVTLLAVLLVLLLMYYFHSGQDASLAGDSTEKIMAVEGRQQPPRVQEQEEKTLLSCAGEGEAVSSAVIIATGEVKNPDWRGQMFYRQAKARDPTSNPLPTVVLLHGAAFSSQTWLDLGTLKFLGCHGYQTFAFDLPGKEKSGELKGVDDSTLIRYLREKFQWSKFVVVSPSMSGRYSLPFVTSGDTKGLIGFVPVAPGAASSFESKMSSVNVNTLHIHGENDKGGMKVQRILQKIPGASEYVMKSAGHPCYTDNPKEFHKVLLKFLENL